jgi:hypothetical protein
MAAGKAVTGGSVKGKVYGGKIRNSKAASAAATPAVGEDDPYKASAQKIALDRFNAAMR